MKKNMGIKLQLLGIALIAFVNYAITFSGSSSTTNIFADIILSIGAFSPLVGLILCIVGFFFKDNRDDSEEEPVIYKGNQNDEE
ncbi:MAG: hypothetical protein ACI4IR_06605 [Eubacterium sp.]